MAALGLLLGVGYAVLTPPMLTSNALVVLPVSNRDIATQVVVAQSDPVLSAARQAANLTMPLDTLRGRLHVKSLTGNVISVSAQGSTAAQAEGLTNAVAGSFITYVTTGNSAVGKIQARLLAPAASASGSSAPGHLVTFGILGVLSGALVGAVAALGVGRGDRRLRERDEIADAIGASVVATVAAGHPSDPAGWTKLLEQYEPGVIEAWSMRRALNQLGLVDLDLKGMSEAQSPSLAVLSLSFDRKALGVGPQLAVFVASLGIPTVLVIGPQQDETATASLRAACSALMAQGSGSAGNVRVAVWDQDGYQQQPGSLAIIVAVVDGQAPQVADTMRGAVTVLGVSAGSATAEQLARVAVSAAADRRGIAGIIVADPDAADHTTGRLPQPVRPVQRRLPTRLTGTTTETRR
jgi:capsular polysaccharide biosynthesis protein